MRAELRPRHEHGTFANLGQCQPRQNFFKTLKIMPSPVLGKLAEETPRWRIRRDLFKKESEILSEIE